MRQAELDRLRYFVENEQQNLCSTALPLIEQLLGEAKPEPEPPPPHEPVELEFDLEYVRHRAKIRRRVASEDVMEMVEMVDRVLACQENLECMGVVARQSENRPFRHSHYAAAAAMLRPRWRTSSRP